MKHRSSCAVVITLGAIGMLAGCALEGEELAARSAPVSVWEKDNPILPLPGSPLGIATKLSDLPDPPTPAKPDGSVPTLRAVIELYNNGGIRNPHLDRKIKPLGLTDPEIQALVKFMEALTGESYLDKPPNSFPSATHVQSRKEKTHGSNR